MYQIRMIPGAYYVPDTYVPHSAATRRRETDEARATHTHSNVRVTTAASETEGVAAVSWTESLMIRRPFGSIDPNSIRETELHTESRRRHSRGEKESLHSPQLDRERYAARQRAAATRRRETDEARAERCVCDCLHVCDCLPPELTNGTHKKHS